MSEIIDQTNWAAFFREYSNRNEGRPTRLGVFEARDGVSDDYWIEDGLPLVAMDLYSDKGRNRVDIHFENYTHAIHDPSSLVYIGDDGPDQGLDILDAEGKTTVLRFENWKTGSEG